MHFTSFPSRKTPRTQNYFHKNPEKIKLKYILGQQRCLNPFDKDFRPAVKSKALGICLAKRFFILLNRATVFE